VPPILDKAREAARGTADHEIFVFGEAEPGTPFAALLAGQSGVGRGLLPTFCGD
jgi:hypothetical protein